MRKLIFLIVLAHVSPVFAAELSSQTIDPHQLYEQSCARCHEPHARDFVHKKLIRPGENLLGRKSNKDVRELLKAGHGKLRLEEIETIVDHMTIIYQSGRLYHKKCRICHDRSVKFARLNLILKEGKLFGRYSGKDIEQFLSAHGRLKTNEVSKMVDVLKRQLITTKNKD